MNQLLVCLLAIFLLLGNSATAQSTEGQQARRFSIAISGGASKGAYEAGLNWGILKILRDFNKIDPKLLGYGREIDLASFSGASAGGINTLLSALGWCSRPESEGGLPNRIDSNIFRDAWMIPDVNHLLPPTVDSKYYSSNDALLARYDVLQASRKLREYWNKPIFRAGCRVPLGVTVTRVVPEELKVRNIVVQNQRMYIPFEANTQNDGTLGFNFNPRDYPTLSDPAMILMPRAHNTPPFSIDDQRIEDAVMTSAAYPGGFGRKKLQYCRLKSYTTANEDKPEEKINQELACPEGYELEEAEFADGGLFDNLPIGLARKLAEHHKDAKKNVLPVTYLYLDPNRLRYTIPSPADTRACASDNPPKACQIMEFSFLTEQALLLDAFGTARKYELYRELTSKYWLFNLTQLSYELARNLEEKYPRFDCKKYISFVNASLTCAESVRRAGTLMELAYNRATLPISSPYSVEKLITSGIAYDCKHSKKSPIIQNTAVCKINAILYRKLLAKILLNIAENNEQLTKEFIFKVHKAKLSIHNDRRLRVSSRGAPITGTLMDDFGAFLDLKFREYDYYVGVYDAVIAASKTICWLNFSEQYQKQKYLECQNSIAHNIYNTIGVSRDPRGQYIFSRLAKWEFGEQDTFQFSSTPQPKEDRDMRIIFDGLKKALEAGERSDISKRKVFFTEDTFFLHLNENNFKPTPTNDGTSPLLTQIIADPKKWTSEMTRRITTRIVYLEQQAEAIYAAREPDPEKREKSHTVVMGAVAHSLQTATYDYPDFTFSPSTAPKNWVWRNVIPYEIGLDIAQSDTSFTWQPTWVLSNNNLFVVRASLGFNGGIIETDKLDTRENYGALGLGYTRQTNSATISSWGLTPTWYHTWSNPSDGKQNTSGGDVHVSFFKDRLRLGLGARDFNSVSDTWFLTIGLTDLPGLIYWLTR